MKKIYLLQFFLPLFCLAQHSDFIHVDQFGYRVNNTKVAVISNPQIGFNSALNYTPNNSLEVRDANTNTVIFTGLISSWNNGGVHSQSGDNGWWFDFSSVTNPGSYYIFDPSTSESSAIFEINDAVYDDILKVTTKMFYYNRANIEKTTPYVSSEYVDGISFTQDEFARDVYDQTNTLTTKDMRGGWFDAGDNNKYVTFAETAVHDLLWAYTINPNMFGDDFNIPESGNGIPDIIDEIKWETDWLLKMINADGSVHIKVGNRNYGENVNTPPSLNNDIRYYAPVCTSSAIANASMLSHASRVFKEFPPLSNYAQTLEEKAELCWQWVLPFLNNNTLQEHCDDGSVVAGDADRSSADQRKMALTAAIYLYDITGNSSYNQYIINNINDTEVINNNQWENYAIREIDALLHYTTLNNADNSTVNLILNSAQTASSNNYNNYFQFNNLDLYRGYCNDWTYHWGSNSSRASMGNLNLIFKHYNINTTASSSFGLRAKEILHYFHGVNPLDIVYLSSMQDYGAENSLKEIYHFWFADGSQWDNEDTTAYGPAPGYLSGGCNQNYTANTNLTPPYGQPLQKSYLDFNTSNPDNSWEISEPAIYYQAAYIRLLAGIARLNENDILSNNDFELSTIDLKLSPNPSKTFVTINGINYNNISVTIRGINGQTVLNIPSLNKSETIDISKLQDGFYVVSIALEGKTKNLKLIKN
ncbi:glycoside hydrolase family 9 protein [Ichthyenterobacterium sp. W332]|uniref:Glycoside hydrolase family 9 protein n=1 Tax=Microcosmobacter mediterraneus TaxID=3075607 RepID=A0ABU2YGE7_9FLAO|nr:glycoside hydrolase family 9 protein [Ichthyenterobacterium sp. W332]MDT0557112.1 glycoside hydrolase family 9 protein [Ichthyenterobacterium sp. W332]